MSDNADQITFWSEEAGRNWVTNQQAMDALLQPVLDLVLTRADLKPGQQVLDVGCGAGASTRAAARLVQPDGRATGVDVSAPLLEAARQQGGVVTEYEQADAQTFAFQPDQFDALISRFGVMFFNDPTVAFENLRIALKPGATLSFAAWGLAPENPYFMIPAAVARAHFGPMPKTDRTQPGPFAFEHPERIRQILSAAGYTDISITAEQIPLPAPDLEVLAELCTRIGPAEAAMRHFDGSEDDRLALRTALADAFAPLDGTVPALINMVRATA